MVSYARLHCSFSKHCLLVLIDECIIFVPVMFSCGASGSSTAWLIYSAQSSMFKAFHPLSNITTDTHAYISAYMTKLLIDVCSYILLHKLAKQHIIDSHFVTADCGNPGGAHMPDLCSYWRP